MKKDKDECTCPHIMVGMRRSGSRNLSPNCSVHGEEAKRKIDELFAGPPKPKEKE